MSVLRLASVSRVLRPQLGYGTGLCLCCGRALVAEHTGGLAGRIPRWSSSAKPKDEATTSACHKMELIEVLESRVKQLQAKEDLSGAKKRCVQQEGEKLDESKKCASAPKRWMQKVKKEQMLQGEKRTKVFQFHSTLNKPYSNPKKDSTEDVRTFQKKTNPPCSMEDQSSSTFCTPSAKPTKDMSKIRSDDFRLTGNDRELLIEDKDGNQYGLKQQNIQCFLEICIFLGDLKKAYQVLVYYQKRPAKSRLLNTAMFNSLMKHWANKASLTEIGDLFSLLEKTRLKPNVGSYAAALEAFGRSQSNTQGIESCLKQMEKDGMSIDQLFQELTYCKDEREMVLKAIRLVQPDFQPPPRLQVVCSSPLVKEFYEKQPRPSYLKMDCTVADLQKRFEEQLMIESADTVTIQSVEATNPVTDFQVKARAVLAGLRSYWKKALLRALRDSKDHLAGVHKKSCKINLYPFLCLLEDEQYVEIMMQALSNIPPTGESFLMISEHIGTKMYNKSAIKQKLQGGNMDQIRCLYMEYCKLFPKEGEVSGLLPRELWENLEYEKYGGPCRSNISPWPRSTIVELGTYLVDIMVETLKLENNIFNPQKDSKLIPVLYHMYSFRNTRQIGLIKPHPIYNQILIDAGETLLTFDAAVMPMKCVPLPWLSPRFGPYLLSTMPLMRCVEGAVQHQLLLEKCTLGQLHPVLDSLNQLGVCSWRINKPILDIVVSIFNEKGNEKLDIPPPLSEAPVLPVHLRGELNAFEKQAYQKELFKCRKKANEMYSLRMDALYKLSIASHLRDQIFWFPHNMDFRGRTYPCPPHFNHLGSDVNRALLVFAEGHPLGPNGLDWLKIHLVNLTGLKKKCSLKQRKEYADEIMEDILDSADHPLTGRKWWMETDKPWQTLASCMELASAMRFPEPEKYISHFPIHQDGSCNGLQHYAALGRDEIGGKSVNLMPCDNPQDVYSEVAQQVEEFRKGDAQEGIRIAQILEGFIDRKVVKQTVMTVVYGVTKYGSRLQIEKRLQDMDDFPQQCVWEASQYLVHQVFKSLKEMFSSTREIQHWLTESARMISKSGSTVEWVTPLGLPIIHPYHRSKNVLLHGPLQKLSLKSTHDVSEKPDTLKQKNAFPPNFIHSLDSTHMMLTALHCYRLGLTFVSVHDCFWTHADNVDIMNKVCREQFVSLHSQPILEELSQFLLQKYCINLQASASLKLARHLSNVPETGTFNLQDVKDSTYFFS